MAFGKWLSLILIPVLFGCKAVSTTTGVREPDLTFLQHAERRVQVEKVLGRREWTPGSADGLTYEIYQFRAAQPSRPVLGAVILAVDALSFGSMEIGLRDANDFKPVKQVAVGYDDQDMVRFVSKEWLVDTPGPLRRMRSVLPKEANIPELARPVPQPRQSDPAGQITILERELLTKVEVDGSPLKGHQAKLEPGPHTVDYSVGLTRGHGVIKMLPGRSYYIRSHHYITGYHTTGDLIWIEDQGSDEVLHCSAD